MDLRAVIVCAVLGLTSGKRHDSGPSDVVSLVKAVGDNVVFIISRDPAPYTNLIWTFSKNANPIFSVIDGVNSTLDSYADRITLLADGSLELRNLMEFKDRGNYTVSITSTEAPEFNRVFSLKIVMPVSNVRLSASATDLIEGNRFSLDCTASGSYRHFSWYNQSKDMGFDSYVVGFSQAVSRYDTGPFRCDVHNDINRVSSEDVYLTISYGPKVTLTTVPLQDIYAEGSNVTLTCTVDSKPEAEITWRRGRRLLPFNGEKLVLEDLSYSQRGTYSCEAYNTKTEQRESKSQKISFEHKGLSVGAQVGIALACVAVVGGAAAGLAYLYFKKR